MYTTFSYSDRDKYGHLSYDFLGMVEEKLNDMFQDGMPSPSPEQVE